MAENEKLINGKRLFVTIFLVVFTSALTFGITWIVMDKTVRDDQKTNDELVQVLQAKITDMAKNSVPKNLEQELTKTN